MVRNDIHPALIDLLAAAIVETPRQAWRIEQAR